MVLERKEIGWVFPDVDSLLAHAHTLEGFTAQELAVAVGDSKFNRSPEPEGKTGVGALVELYLGKKSDSLRRPDFENLGVELKTLPMKSTGKTQAWKIKEPTTITMIDYFMVDKEPWDQAYVRHKIDRILWVPYEHNYADKRLSRFRKAFLWSPPPTDYPVFEQDYSRVQKCIRDGRAHELSESISAVLAARRKGVKDSMKPQPHSPEPAKSRAWAFKPAYTRPLLARYVLGETLVSIVESVEDVKTLADVETYVQNRLARYRGKTLAEIRSMTGATLSGGKNGPASFVRSLVGLKARGNILEFEKLGVRIQTVWAHPDSKALWEAISFPKMVLKEFAEEDWSESELQDLVDRILFIPTYSRDRKAKDSRVLGTPFFWSPSPEEWSGIQAEWRKYQEAVAAGGAQYHPVLNQEGKVQKTKAGRVKRENKLPKMTETRYIHIRPHGRDSHDLDVDPLGEPTTKQCFWLNKAFVQSILQKRA